RVGAPVGLDFRGICRHWVCLNADGPESQALTLDDCRTRPTEWIQNDTVCTKPKLTNVFTDQVRGERQDESVPVVNSTVVRIQAIAITVFCAVPGNLNQGGQLGSCLQSATGCSHTIT